MDAIKTGEAIGVTNWAYLYSSGQRAAFQISKFVARWILGPVTIVVVYYAGYQEIATWIGIPYGIYILIHIAFLPRRYLRRKARGNELKNLGDKLNGMMSVFQSSSVEIFNPSRLRDLIAKTESEEMLFRPAVYSILDRAVERDAAVFVLEDSGRVDHVGFSKN